MLQKIPPSAPETLDEITEDNITDVQGQYEKIKISKGEESNFIWSVIYTLLEQVILTLNEPDFTNRITNKFDNLEYVFIDDPVSSLDDTHLIELAIDLVKLIKISTYTEGNGLKFIITTHNPLFYNVLYNELNNDLKNTIKMELQHGSISEGSQKNIDCISRAMVLIRLINLMTTLFLIICSYCQKYARQ